MTYEEFQTQVRALSGAVDAAGRELSDAYPSTPVGPAVMDSPDYQAKTAAYFGAMRELKDFRAAAPSDYRRRAGAARYNRYVRPV